MINRRINVKIEKNNEKSLKSELDLHGYDFHSKNTPRKKLSKFPYNTLKIIVLNREVIVLRSSNLFNLIRKIFIRYLIMIKMNKI